MLYTHPLPFWELDRLMRGVPNFPPRRHGVVIIRREYTAEDCDCRYFRHYSGSR